MKSILRSLLCLALVLFAVPLQAQTYKGCYSDNSTRALPNLLIASGATVESCMAAAKAYAFAGLQYGGQCWAGNTLGFTPTPDANCNTPCSANSKEMCGGGWFNSAYAVGGVSSIKGTGTVMCSPTSGNAICTGTPQSLGLCASAPAVGSACNMGDSCFLINQTPAPASTTFFLCGTKSLWWKAGPFTAMPN